MDYGADVSSGNCRLSSHVTSGMEHRLFQLCEEGNAARWLLIAMLVLQGAVLGSHAWDWVDQKRSAALAGTRQRQGDKERLDGSKGA